MKTIATTILTGLLALSLVIPLSAGAGESIEYSIARGGRLYDKWFAENDSDAPTDPHPTYAAKRKYDGKRGGDWRCKECHGWDYLGKDGAYGEGKHKTGFRGIRKAAGMAPEKIAALLRNKVHGYTDSMLSDKDIRDLANFVSKGQIDMNAYIDRASGKAKGDASRGKAIYQTICGVCHNLDGMGEDTDPLGKISTENPWKMLHKIRNGHAGEQMPSLQAFDVQSAVDLLSYMQSELPKEEE